jgi:hypothetical protein
MAFATGLRERARPFPLGRGLQCAGTIDPLARIRLFELHGNFRLKR